MSLVADRIRSADDLSELRQCGQTSVGSGKRYVEAIIILLAAPCISCHDLWVVTKPTSTTNLTTDSCSRASSVSDVFNLYTLIGDTVSDTYLLTHPPTYQPTRLPTRPSYLPASYLPSTYLQYLTTNLRSLAFHHCYLIVCFIG